MATKKQYIVQQSNAGGFEVKAKGGAKASAILPTQHEAEKRAEELNPNNRPNVRRVRNTGVGRPGEFRPEDS
ncbi:DUF2188 domain-containing protein [Acidicapsa ligni]|uniref:DUF2188 domain-containing protein n=1 Tax=Acidicapsa ligni TaxID=542300 RepID=UPI0021E0CDC4|nr:DUF2188 domain-containing protein [Acidicapsa ligni]